MKVCPECAETVKSAAVVCRFCGHRFDAEPSEPADEVDGQRRFDALTTWAVLSAAAMVIGAFGPWVTALGVNVAGTDSSNDGWLVFAAAVVAALIVVFNSNDRAAGTWAMLGGVAGAAITIYDRSHVDRAISHAGAIAAALVHVGWGLNLAMIASISLFISGLILFRSTAKTWGIGSDQPSTPAGAIGDFMPVERRDPATGKSSVVYVRRADAFDDEFEGHDPPPQAEA